MWRVSSNLLKRTSHEKHRDLKTVCIEVKNMAKYKKMITVFQLLNNGYMILPNP